MEINTLIPKKNRIIPPEEAADLVGLLDKNQENPYLNPELPKPEIWKKQYSWEEQKTALEQIALSVNRNFSDYLRTGLGGFSFLQKNNNVIQLRLIATGLTKIPEEINYLTSLQYLDLSGNQITNIDSLKNLTSLQTLNLYNNQITSKNAIKSLLKKRVNVYY